MKIKDLEIGKYYGCLSMGKKVLVISTIDAKDKEVKAGLIGYHNRKEDGEVQMGYNVINLYNGQLAELKKQPELKNA